MYKIKQVPEDFIVKEVIGLSLEKKGMFSYFILKKRNYTTLRAAEVVAKVLNIPLKFVGFAGTKDKKAVTEQLISVRSNNVKLLESKELKDIELAFVGYGEKPISLGDLEGNIFDILVRNLKSFDDFKEKGRFVNFFGEQRFSSNNEEVGRAIVKKDFRKAVELILKDEKDYKKKMEDFMEKNPNDHVGTLKKIPKRLLKMYIHAYQSHLWNQTAAKLKDEKENMVVPIVGFGTETGKIKHSGLKDIIKEIMKKENISERDFIIRELQHLSPEGSERKLFADIKELKVIEKADDELNKGKKKIRISFFLEKGCYATEAIKAMFTH